MNLLSPALTKALDDYMTATANPSKQCFQDVLPSEVLRESMEEIISAALSGGKTEAEVIAQLEAAASN